jgi:hypothetical protein
MAAPPVDVEVPVCVAALSKLFTLLSAAAATVEILLISLLILAFTEASAVDATEAKLEIALEASRVAVLKAPAASLVAVLNAPAASLVAVLNAPPAYEVPVDIAPSA